MELSKIRSKLPLRQVLNVQDPCWSQELQEACPKEPVETINFEKEFVNIKLHQNMPIQISTKILFVAKLNANILEVRKLVQNDTDWSTAAFFLQEEEPTSGGTHCFCAFFCVCVKHANESRYCSWMEEFVTIILDFVVLQWWSITHDAISWLNL